MIGGRTKMELEKERDELARSLKEAWSENEKAWALLRDERAKVSKLQAEKDVLEKLVKHLQDVAMSRDEQMLEFSIEVARACSWLVVQPMLLR